MLIDATSIFLRNSKSKFQTTAFIEFARNWKEAEEDNGKPVVLSYWKLSIFVRCLLPITLESLLQLLHKITSRNTPGVGKF